MSRHAAAGLNISIFTALYCPPAAGRARSTLALERAISEDLIATCDEIDAEVLRVLSRFLFHVHALGPLTCAEGAVLMLPLSFSAAWFPARRAASLRPIETLRME